MESDEPNSHGDSVEDESADSADEHVFFGERRILPRVGDEHQVEIPPLLTEVEYRSYVKNPYDADIKGDFPRDFLMGLAMPVTWINNKPAGDVKSNKGGVLESESVKDSKPFPMTDNSNKAKNKMEPRKDRKSRKNGHYLVPGTSDVLWSDFEEAGFLLGLYIFARNLGAVKRFIESKKTEDVLSFYYGKFYKSERYRRWAECKKRKSKRCGFGLKLFTGWRLQELLSRLLPHVSEDRKSTWLEAAKNYGDGKIELENFVTTLKAIVGVHNLIEAFAIGKGKRDLTGTAMDPPIKSNHVVPTRPRMPLGKACSSLTPKEIIEFLTGDFRLSIVRSNDLFWEAVWPRLLARGWHSEEPKNKICHIGSKHALVFLVPGVHKFSRRKLEKGNHYFDSIIDVLNKVAKEPELLKLDAELDEENGWTGELKEELDDVSDRQRHCYLQPPTLNSRKDSMKFTVVDTSLVGDGKTRKVRELRSLPSEFSCKVNFRSHSGEMDASEASTDESVSRDRKDKKKSKRPKINGPDFPNNEEKKTARCNLNERPNEEKEEEDYIAPVQKRRRRLSACGKTNNGMIRFSDEKLDCCSGGPNSSENEFNLLKTPSETGLIETGEEIIRDNTDIGEKKPQLRTLIDLNLPHVPTDSENGEDFMDSREGQHEPENPPTPEETIPAASVDPEQPNANSRRYSTRNRPPTMRALEALASGFLTVKPRKKNKENFQRKDSSTSRASQPA